VTADALQTFKVMGSKIKVTMWRNVGTHKVTEYKLGENYPSAEYNMW